MLHAMDYNVLICDAILRASVTLIYLKNMTHHPSRVHAQLATVELSLWSSLHRSPVLPGADWLQECEARAGPVPTVPNDCTHKKGFNSLSQLSLHTLACKKKQHKTP